MLVLCRKWKCWSLSCVRFFVAPWVVACQAPLSMALPRQEHWSGLPYPSPGDLPNPGIEPGSPALQRDSLLSYQSSPLFFLRMHVKNHVNNCVNISFQSRNIKLFTPCTYMNCLYTSVYNTFVSRVFPVICFRKQKVNVSILWNYIQGLTGLGAKHFIIHYTIYIFRTKANIIKSIKIDKKDTNAIYFGQNFRCVFFSSLSPLLQKL